MGGVDALAVLHLAHRSVPGRCHPAGARRGVRPDGLGPGPGARPAGRVDIHRFQAGLGGVRDWRPRPDAGVAPGAGGAAAGAGRADRPVVRHRPGRRRRRAAVAVDRSGGGAHRRQPVRWRPDDPARRARSRAAVHQAGHRTGRAAADPAAEIGGRTRPGRMTPIDRATPGGTTMTLSYTTTATAWGGRMGRVATSDGTLDYRLSMPESMGGE